MKRALSEAVSTEVTEEEKHKDKEPTLSKGKPTTDPSVDEKKDAEDASQAKTSSSSTMPARKRIKLSKAVVLERMSALGDKADELDVDLSKLSEHVLPNWMPKRTIHFVMENYHTREAVPGVWRWLSNRDIMRALLFDKRFYSLSSHKQIKKEMTEATEQMDTMHELLKQAGAAGDGLQSTDGKRLIVIDVCSGKGFFGVLMTYYFKQATIILCDKDRKMSKEHFAAMDRVHFHLVDICRKGFSLARWIEQRIEEAIAAAIGAGSDEDASAVDDYIVVITGLHLCGNLSHVLAEAFVGLCVPTAVKICLLQLVPCCFPKRDKSVLLEAKQLGKEPLMHWCEKLKAEIAEEKVVKMGDDSLVAVSKDEESVKYTSKVDIVTQEHSLSLKNICVVAVKQRM